MANSSLAINQGTNSAINFDSSNGTFTQVVAPAYGTVSVAPIDLNKQPATSLPGALDVNIKPISGFVTTNGPQFMLKGKPFKYASFNYYPLIIGSDYKKVMDDFKALGATVLRTWCFDGPIGFRSLVYAIGSNILTNGDFETNTTGWTLGGDFTRSNDTAESGSYSIKQVSAGGFSSLDAPVTVVANTDYVLTFWHKTQNVGGFADIIFIGSTPGSNDIKDGGFINDTAGAWQQSQVIFNSGAHTTVNIHFGNFGGTVNAYFDKISVSVKTGLPTLAYNEGVLIGLDTILDEARKRGVKLMLSLADGNFFNYNTKGMYVDWANQIYGTSLNNGQNSTDFFTSPLVKNLYKDFIKTLSQRINTINGIQYKDDPVIFSLELGNELRAEHFDDGSVVNTRNAPNYLLLSAPGGWTDEMSTHVHTWFPNHMCNYGDMGHCADYLQDGSGVGDAVYNGTYDGISYLDAIKLPYISFMDFHIYPTQGDGIHLAANSGKYWGQKFGYLSGPSGDGFRAQLADFVKVAHANNKPCVCGETGEDLSQVADTSLYPLYNRYTYFKNFFKDFIDIPGGDGINIWHAVAAATSGGSYDVALEATGGAGVTDNSNDTDIVNLIKTYNTGFLQDVTPAQAVTGLIKTNGDIISKNLNFNDSTVSVQLSDTWTGTVQFESSIDGITWYLQSLTDSSGNNVTSATAVGLFTGAIGGKNKFRVRASASITGSLTVNIQSTVGIASFGSSSSGGSVTISGGTIQNIAGGTLGTILGIGGTVQVSGASAGTFVNLATGTLNSGTINLGTVVGKDANAAAQTGNPVPIGGTDSGGTVRTVLVDSAGAMKVSGASAGTFVNLTTGTLNAGTINTGTVNAGTINTGTINSGTINLGTMVGKDANAAAQTGNPVALGGTDSGGTVRTILVNSAGAQNIGTLNNGTVVIPSGTITTGSLSNVAMLNAGTISTLPNLPQGSINVTAGTFVMTSGTLNVGTAVMPSGTLNVGTINNGSIVVTAGTIAAGTVHLNGTVTDNFTGLGTFTITLGTLASSGSVGRQSTLVDNTANLWPAALIGCQITSGTVTAAGQVNVYLIRSDNGGGPIQDDLTGASDALGTVNNSPLLGVIPINIGTNNMYKAVYDTSFLGHLGPKFGVMVQHALGNPLAVGGSQSITYQSIMPKFS